MAKRKKKPLTMEDVMRMSKDRTPIPPCKIMRSKKDKANTRQAQKKSLRDTFKGLH